MLYDQAEALRDQLSSLTAIAQINQSEDEDKMPVPEQQDSEEAPTQMVPSYCQPML